MPKFIFVCYEHGTGGEPLAVEISKLKKCNTLSYTKHGIRIWSYDYFNKLFLKSYDKNWKNKIKLDKTSNEFYYVVPSHYDPDIIKEVFPNEFFVVINSPKTIEGIKNLKERIFDHVWLTKHNNLQEKIGFYIENAGKKPSRSHLKKLGQDLLNGEIKCIIHNVEPTLTNMKELFEKVNVRSDRFNYINKKNLFTIDYKDVITNKNENLINNLKMSI
jgi:hypothetical protein